MIVRMSARGTDDRTAYPSIGWPSYAYFTNERRIYFNDEPIIVMHEDAARTDGDSMVLFRRST